MKKLLLSLPPSTLFFCQTSSCLLLCFPHRLFLSCCTYKVTRSYNSTEPQLKILITFWKLKKWCTLVYYRSTLSTFHLYEGHSYRCDTTNTVQIHWMNSTVIIKSIQCIQKIFIGAYVSWLKQTSAHLYNEVLNLKLKSFMSPFVMTWVNLPHGYITNARG